MSQLHQITDPKFGPTTFRHLPSNSSGQDTVQDPAIWSRQSITAQLLILFLTLVFVTIIRRRYFTPLSHIPGPFLASFSRLWHMRYIIRGDQQMVLAKAHEKYGPFVRIAHDEVSVCHENAVKSLFIAPLHKVSPLGMNQLKYEQGPYTDMCRVNGTRSSCCPTTGRPRRSE